MKNNITREELKKIHDIACDTWKTKIKDYGSKDPFSETIKFTEKQINEMIKAFTDVQLPVVKEIFDVRDSWEDIKTVEDACKHLGEVDNEVRQLRLLQNIPNLDRKVISGQELVVISKALNNGTELDWDDHNEYKYFPWWYLGKNFRVNGVYYYSNYSHVPARLCVKSIEIGNYSATQFKDIWKDYMN